ncbi:amidohydrolase [Seminavis robusta]|uniref:Amidohydrolase n=1 Tax=Seminavis robusta TaxID=568900 RepID=A0A9N8D8I6_9STRA|nr:amidohydrolase [Seminavis robusta]|eukprot:Sro15_g011200.1 amidohydrolase (434) ;mRNA; f:95496-96797
MTCQGSNVRLCAFSRAPLLAVLLSASALLVVWLSATSNILFSDTSIPTNTRQLFSHGWGYVGDLDTTSTSTSIFLSSSNATIIDDDRLFEGENATLESVGITGESDEGKWYLGLDDWWNRVDYQGSKVSAVDMHLHTGLFQDVPPSFQDQILGNIPFPLPTVIATPLFNVILSGYGICAQLVCAKIRRGVIFAVYAPTTTGLTTNQFVHGEIQKLPKKLWGLASLPVNDWDKNEERALNLLRKYLALPEFIGIKLAHPHMLINLNDARFYSIYDVAREFNKPVYCHTGKTLSTGSLTNKEATHPAFLEEAIQLYPDVLFILGHVGNGADFDGLEDPIEACFRLTLTYSNVYMEVSAVGSASNDPNGDKLFGIFRDAKQLELIRRLIYGSDGPQSPGFVLGYLERTIHAMERANYTDQEAERVLNDNFQSVFWV